MYACAPSVWVYLSALFHSWATDAPLFVLSCKRPSPECPLEDMPCPLLHEKVDLLREQELRALADAVHRLSKQIETLLAAGKS